MAIPIKKVRKEKVAILHACSEQKTLEQLIKTSDKLTLILVGNGNPKDGYVYKVDEMGRDVREIKDKLTGISGVVTELHEASVGKNAVAKTEKERRAENRLVVQKWIQVFAFIVAALGLVFTAYFSLKGLHKAEITQDKVDNIGIPFVTNSRGEILALPDSSRILYFPYDSLRYTIKRER